MDAAPSPAVEMPAGAPPPPPPLSPPPPLPDLPKAPSRKKLRPALQAAPPEPSMPQETPRQIRELAKDPALREGQRATVRAAAETVLGLFSIVGAQLPPHRPLSAEEQAMLRPSLEDTVYKYGGEIDPALALVLALGAVAGMRFMEWKTSTPAKKSEATP